MIAFIVWSIVALLFWGIGNSARRSKEAVGFFTFEKPPAVSDVSRYNHSVSILWKAASVILEMLGVFILFLKQNSPLLFLVLFGVLTLVMGMMIAYCKIKTKYKA